VASEQSETTDLVAKLRGAATAPGILAGSPVVAANRNLLRDAAKEIDRLRATLIKIGSYQGKSMLEMGEMARGAINDAST
jgi:hypothetical protein